MSTAIPSAIANDSGVWSLRAALVIAHPGHELRLYDWLNKARPDVHILTNGSRSRAARTRREASMALLKDVGCRAAGAWSGVADATLYEHVIAQRHRPFLDCTAQLAADLVDRDIEMVVTDAWQYYNIAHDLTHLMARVAAREASAQLERNILVLECQIAPSALAPTAPAVRRRSSKSLSPEAAARKREVSHLFPDVETEIADIETHEAESAYAIEQLFEPAPIGLLRAPPAQKPAYEVYGEARVAAGLYKDVLRWRHAASLIETLAERHDACEQPAEHAAAPAMRVRVGGIPQA